MCNWKIVFLSLWMDFQLCYAILFVLRFSLKITQLLKLPSRGIYGQILITFTESRLVWCHQDYKFFQGTCTKPAAVSCIMSGRWSWMYAPALLYKSKVALSRKCTTSSIDYQNWGRYFYGWSKKCSRR